MNRPESALRVVLADDHHFFREGLRSMLEADGVTVVGEAADGEEAVSLARSLAPDVMVIDLNMPGASGVEALRRIAQASPLLRTVVLTVSDNVDDVIEALSTGACGYLLKDMPRNELIGAIRQAAGGHAVLSSESMRTLMDRLRVDSQRAGKVGSHETTLTARELEVLKLIVTGADNAAIGRELSISRHTVKQYVTNIFEKLDVRSRVAAAVYAVRSGLA